MGIFKDHFNSIADILQSRFEGIKEIIKHPSDKGELCEIFVKEFLHNALSDVYRIVRGGKIVNIDGLESKQSDILLIGKNTIKIFEEKGLYPMESVFGVFSITANLDKDNFFSCIEECKDIPKVNPRLHTSIFAREKVLKDWEKFVPIKCIFAYDGSINEEWEKELNEAVSKKPEEKNYFPDLIVINKKGIIIKIIEKPTMSIDGISINKDFHYTRFGKPPESYTFYGAALEHILVKLYNLGSWQFFITPEYHEYFNKDMFL
jgi:hypothetical protein